MTRRALLCVVIAVAGATGATAQQPTFRSSVETVEVDVRVTDRDGRPVADLNQSDFELREDGKRQVISSAMFVRLGPASADAAVVNTAASVLSLDGRAYVLVLDDLHVDPRSSSRVTALAMQFIERNVTPADRVSIRTTGGGSGTPFTGDAAALKAALSRFSGRKLPPASIEESDRRAQSRELNTWTNTDDPFARERAINARAAMSTLREAAISLSQLRGRRKAILYFSEGIDYDVTDAIGRADKGSEADSILQGMREAVGLANQTNASFYTIDPRGSSQNAADVVSSSNLDRDATAAMRRELMMSQSSLREIADLTGGAAAVNTNNLTSFYERVVADGDAYYMLSYAPSTDRPRKGYHKLEVKVTRRGLRVRARPGYSSTPEVATETATTTTASAAPPAIPERVTPAVSPAIAPVAAPDSTAGAAEDPEEPELPDVMDRIANYVGEYQSKLAGLVAEEHYRQNIVNMSGPMRGRTQASATERDLRSDLLLVRPAGEDQWVQFRDVFEVDGRTLRDRDERLYKLFVEPTASSRRQAEVIQEEGARYNIGPLMRTINVPIMALTFLAEENQPSFSYKRVKAGDLRGLADVAKPADVWVIEYRETAKQTLIRGANNRNIPSRGKVWVEARSGRVLRTELMSADVEVKAEIYVDYRPQSGVELLVPVEMREQYALMQSTMRIEGRATYNRFRRFTVSTSERQKPQ